MRPKKTGIPRIIDAGRHSLDGLATSWREEAAFRQECGLGMLFLLTLPFLDRSGLENAVMVGSLALVLIAELLNTGIEKAIDRVGYEDHPLSKFAKDAGSAGVFVALVNVPVMWGLILLG
jgi:diacylglycerol kinase (ATP)